MPPNSATVESSSSSVRVAGNTIIIGEQGLLIAAVEGGGTAFKATVCQLSDDAHTVPRVLYKTQVDSSRQDPYRCLTDIARFLTEHRPPHGYAALGISTFGPAGVRPDKPDLYGKILSTTPK